MIPVDSGGNQPEPTGIEDGGKFSVNTPHPRPPTSLAVLGNPEICSAIPGLAITAEQQQTIGVITLAFNVMAGRPLESGEENRPPLARLEPLRNISQAVDADIAIEHVETDVDVIADILPQTDDVIDVTSHDVVLDTLASSDDSEFVSDTVKSDLDAVSVESQNDEVERIFSHISPVLVATGSHLRTDTGVASAASHFSAFQPVQRSSSRREWPQQVNSAVGGQTSPRSHKSQQSRLVTPCIPVAHRSRNSSRASVLSAIPDLNWVGNLVTKITSDATEREKRDAEERERLRSEALAERQRLAAEALERERKLAADALGREKILFQEKQAEAARLLNEKQMELDRIAKEKMLEHEKALRVQQMETEFKQSEKEFLLKQKQMEVQQNKEREDALRADILARAHAEARAEMAERQLKQQMELFDHKLNKLMAVATPQTVANLNEKSQEAISQTFAVSAAIPENSMYAESLCAPCSKSHESDTQVPIMPLTSYDKSLSLRYTGLSNSAITVTAVQAPCVHSLPCSVAQINERKNTSEFSASFGCQNLITQNVQRYSTLSPELDTSGYFVKCSQHSDKQVTPRLQYGRESDIIFDQQPLVAVADHQTLAEQSLPQMTRVDPVVPLTQTLGTQMSTMVDNFKVPLEPSQTGAKYIPLSSIRTEGQTAAAAFSVVQTPSGPAVKIHELPASPLINFNAGQMPTQVTVAQAHPSRDMGLHSPGREEILSQPAQSTAAVTNIMASVSPPNISASQSRVISHSPVAVSSSSSLSPPVVVIQQHRVHNYDGSTNWENFRDHFRRVAKVNNWNDDKVKCQFLMLSLVGKASEVLRDIDENSPTLYSDIWAAIARRFGDSEEQRDFMRKFDRRRQMEGESIPEYEQGLRTLYRKAWPAATSEQKDMALKTAFEEGLLDPQLMQYLRLHAGTDNFSDTVQKAKKFVATTEQPKNKKSVRIITPVEDSTSNSKSDKQSTSVLQRLDSIEDMIRGMTAGQSNPHESPQQQNKGKNSSVCPKTSHPSKAQTARLADAPHQNYMNRPLYTQPFSGRPHSPAQPHPQTAFPGPAPGPDRPSGRPRGRCWVCSSPGCHSDFHVDTPQRPQRGPPRSPCWTCGVIGCHSRNHMGQVWPSTPPNRNVQPAPENNPRARNIPANRSPTVPPRPASQ